MADRVEYMAKFYIGNTPVDKRTFLNEMYQRYQNGRDKTVNARVSTTASRKQRTIKKNSVSRKAD